MLVNHTDLLRTVEDVTLDYLRSGIENYDTVMEAVSEAIEENFNIKRAIADKFAEKYVGKIWQHALAQVEAENESAVEWENERSSALMDAALGRW